MRILVIVPPYRPDFYHYLEQDDKAEYFLLWNEKKKYSENISKFFKGEYFWEMFSTPRQLLESINPDKLVFFEIIDQRQIALLVVANALRKTTFYLEHGAAGDRQTALKRSKTDRDFLLSRIQYVAGRILSNSTSIIKSKIFYFAATPYLKSLKAFIKFMWLPAQMLISKPNKALQLLSFPERVPRYALTFNQVNFEEYELYTRAPVESAILTGIPGFDSYALSKKEHSTNEIVYIEHPYLEDGLCGWNEQHHERVARKLFEFAIENKIYVLIKLHPRSNKKRWESYQMNSMFFKITQHQDLTQHLLNAKLILSYSSSLLTGLLCVQKNIVLLGWHPAPQIFGVDFSKTQLCHVSMNIEDLNSQLIFWTTNNLAIKNQHLFDAFLSRFNSPFDGKAGQRVIETIHTR